MPLYLLWRILHSEWYGSYVMRNSKDRRDSDSIARVPLEDNDRERVFAERREVLLISYAVASMAYRCVVIAGIIFFLDALLRPYR